MSTRREWIHQTAKAALLLPAWTWRDQWGLSQSNRIHIGACDWSLGKSGDPAAFEVARKIGLDGVQISMGSVDNNLHLRQPEIQKQYREASKRTGVAIGGLALGILNEIPYKTDPRTEEWVWDSVDVAQKLGVKSILLAFFSNNDLRNDPAGQREVIRRLKIVAPKAEKVGVRLGIESYLSAEVLTDMIQQVGSSSIKVYYDFRNSANAGYDVIRELKLLGKDAICELHMKEDGFLLGKGTLNWQAIADTLLDMNYHGEGWMQIEGATPQSSEVIPSYQHNLQFLKSIFHYS